MSYIKLFLLSIFHPIRSFEIIKRNREKYSYIPALVILAIAIIERILYIYFVNFTVAGIRVVDANLVIELAKILIPLITWIICSFALLSIMGGEATFRETVLGCVYSLSPYVFFAIPLIIVSKAITIDEASIFSSVSNIIFIWVILLLLVNLKVANDISLRRTFGIAFLTICSMLILCAVLLIIAAIIVQLGIFGGELNNELKFLK